MVPAAEMVIERCMGFSCATAAGDDAKSTAQAAADAKVKGRGLFMGTFRLQA
jgi:hypothetical protein